MDTVVIKKVKRKVFIPPTVQPATTEASARLHAHLEKNRLAQAVAKKRRQESAQFILALMSAKWPTVFSSDARIVPLKKRIHLDVRTAFPELSFKKVKLGINLYFYYVRFKYLKAIIAGGPRFDLNGQECGTVTAEEQAIAQKQLAKLKTKKG